MRRIKYFSNPAARIGLTSFAKKILNILIENSFYSIYIVPEKYFIVVHLLVNKKEFQILDQRDGKNKGNVLSDFPFAFSDSMKS